MRFAEVFTYDHACNFMGGRRFYQCILLKDMYDKKQGDYIREIIIYSTRYICFDRVEDIYRFYMSKEPSLEKVQYEVKKRLLNDLHIDPLKLCQDIEDFYGFVFSYRTTMFIEHYRMALFYEFEKSASFIKHHWKRVTSIPSYIMCQRRLMREFLSM